MTAKIIVERWISMKAALLGLVLGIAGLSVQAQRAPDPAQPEQSHYTPVSKQKVRELVCREQAARDMQKPVVLPPGATRAWEHERVQRERLCLMNAAESGDAAALETYHYDKPAPSEQSHYTPSSTQKLSELACREQAARDMQKPVALPPGATRAWEFERVQRERLCLMKATEASKAEPQTYRHKAAAVGHQG